MWHTTNVIKIAIMPINFEIAGVIANAISEKNYNLD